MEDEIDPEQRPTIDRAWVRVESRLAALPEPLATAAADFLARRRPQGSHRDYFSDLSAAPLLYLPLWLRTGLRRRAQWSDALEAAVVESVTCGAMWGYFYLRIQDDALDEREAPREDLLLGNVFVVEMLRCFTEAAAGDPELGEVLERAFVELSRLTLAERQQLASDRPYAREAFEEHAGKVAFASVPLQIVLRRAGLAALAPEAERLVASLGIACGLLNDARGFARDLANGQRTYLLARAGCQRPSEGAEVDEALRSRLYEGGLLASFDDEAREAFGRATEHADALGCGPELRTYVQRVQARLDQTARARLALSVARALGTRSRTGS